MLALLHVGTISLDKHTTIKTMRKPCHHCDGNGYIQLRDCAGDIQRDETCVFCEGRGELDLDDTPPIAPSPQPSHPDRKPRP
jgi:hypothetical protein